MKHISSVRRQMVIGGLIGSAGFSVQAQEKFPAKPIRFIVPMNPGGAVDGIARAVAEAVHKRVGQPVLVENKVGASGMLATDYVAKSPPDGYTLTFSLSTALLINQFLYSKMPYNPQTDLLMLSEIASAAVVLVADKSVPATDMKSLLEWAKANKGKVSYGSWGIGSYAHLGGAYMSKMTDSDMAHIAYKGEAPMMQDLLGGRLQFCFTSALNAKQHIDAGSIKAIGVTGKSRMQVLPNVPTIYEQGVRDEAFLVTGWLGMAAPKGLPASVTDALYKALNEASQDPVVRDRIAAAGFVSVFSSPSGFAKSYQADMQVWKNLVDVAGAKLE